MTHPSTYDVIGTTSRPVEVGCSVADPRSRPLMQTVGGRFHGAYSAAGARGARRADSSGLLPRGIRRAPRKWRRYSRTEQAIVMMDGLAGGGRPQNGDGSIPILQLLQPLLF